MESSTPSLASSSSALHPPPPFMFLADPLFAASVARVCMRASMCVHTGLLIALVCDCLPWRIYCYLFSHGSPGPSSETRGEPGNVTPSPSLVGSSLVWGQGSHPPSHPQTLLLRGLGRAPAISSLPQGGVLSFTLLCKQDREDFESHHVHRLLN